ncbi:DUF1549 domain-containing protein [Gimesia maris]|jgi:hypothetical protein|uniref:DUF1549 domain-containing protein n=1 Tax=Gimesia maris TaxID=122 RepID=A0ABX5YV93_9PLAN|nr:DUF1549 domain-containing protein [Gimesia maris]EDL61396.1 hypothetical protein PM8797T_12868 [Gimesia maris DSM 8797]QDU17540.1 hypothetical protein CA11_53830 [Gimesia maris]QEG19565.1 hypothetical protein GmarT_54660 [Gimesia maris]QGQ27595.1 DUF1549 domain-containing protein [Gimesia maris]
MRRFSKQLSVVFTMLICVGSWVSLADAAPQESRTKAFSTGAFDPFIDYINGRIRQGWEDNEVEPSPVASDEEWLRRVHLDLIGQIPSAELVEQFSKDRDPAKRSKIVDKLLEDPAYVQNFTNVWTNLLIGRRTPRRVSRSGMQKFLREAFAKNRPWDEIVQDLVTAEGHFEENGAVNYLLAQMQNNDEAVQVTAATTRLFLGIQVQCTQCHNHPFNDWKQNQFWEYNSFFRQMRRVNHRKTDPKTGRQIDDYSEIVATGFNGPVYYEKRSGLMQVAYPIFEDQKVDPQSGVERRKEFSKLIVQGDKPLIATAIVNRMWGYFMGYGFTRPVDDMGPHNPASHPELLNKMAEELVKKDYDLKQLARWICNTEAYNLTSQFGRNNEIDSPERGETPLFSHMYIKNMTAEQLYDSLIVATGAHKSGQSNWERAEEQRRRWMGQFMVAFDNDSGDDSTTFNGTIPQALMMMNGDLTKNAISAESGSYLNQLLTEKGNDQVKIRKMFLSTLNRYPDRREINSAQRLISGTPNKLAAYQDLYWALLNSNEFVFNH